MGSHGSPLYHVIIRHGYNLQSQNESSESRCSGKQQSFHVSFLPAFYACGLIMGLD